MRLKNKKVLVYGLGSSGISVLERLIELKAKIFLFDKDKEKAIQVANKYNVSTFISLSEIKLIIVSPGVRKDDKILLEAIRLNIPIISELEFGYRLNKKATYIAVTGTNGKTTTVNMIHSVMKAYNSNCMLLGNVGTPLSSVKAKDALITLEVSSFQLEYIDKFKAKISVILNLAPDHLDRYNNLDDYYTYKKRIVKNSTNDYLVLNYDDENLKDFKPSNCNIYYFSLITFVNHGAYLYNNKIYFVDGGSSEEIMDIKDLKIIGIHNIANAMATIVVSKLQGVPTNIIQHVLKNFKGLKHRFELVCEENGVIVINDSKATNVASTVSAYKNISSGSYVLLGGSSKGEKYDQLFQNKNQKFHYYLFGDTAEEMYETAKNYGVQNKCIIFDSLFEAVDLALHNAKNGEMVVLTPACASFDSFKNYEDRGEQFIEYVRAYYEK